MSIYSTFFALDDDDHDESCNVWRDPLPNEESNMHFWSGRDAVFDESIPCSCNALGPPYKYDASHKSITGPDHPRASDEYGYFSLSQAVGTHTVRLGLGEESILLDARQVKAIRDSLDSLLRHDPEPEDYNRENAYDAVNNFEYQEGDETIKEYHDRSLEWLELVTKRAPDLLKYNHVEAMDHVLDILESYTGPEGLVFP